MASLNISSVLRDAGMNNSSIAIQVRGLRKSYGDVEAVRGIDLEISTGEVFALLGPNGAGKTTTIEILEGYLNKSAGEVQVLGYDPARKQREFRERIGIVLQSTGVQPYLNVEETIDLFRGYYPHPMALEDVLHATGLGPQRKTRVKKLSGGQQRRLDVAIGLSGGPDLLFLDEPTTGFDPSARRDAWEMIRNLQELGKTVVLTTHYMDEAQNLADRVAIMVQGKIVVEGTPDELLSHAGGTTIRYKLSQDAPPMPEGLDGGTLEPDGHLVLVTNVPTQALHGLTSWATSEGIELEELSVTRPSLDDLFVQLVMSERSDEA